MPRRLRSLVMALAAAAAAAGCQDPPGRLRPRVFDPASSGAPDADTWGGRVWHAERHPSLGAYEFELAHWLPLQFQPYRAIRFFVLSGQARVRAGAEERLLGPGAFISIPTPATYRITPMGARAPRLLALISPDGEDAVIIEMPSVMRRLMPTSTASR